MRNRLLRTFLLASSLKHSSCKNYSRMTNLAHDQKDQNRLEARLSAEFIMHDPNFPRGISDGFVYDEQRAILKTSSPSRYVPHLHVDDMRLTDARC
jgi:hypothetical protein